MKPWYSQRELYQIVNMFHKAVVANDPEGAGAVYGCLFDFLQTARTRTESRSHGYRWKRMASYLEDALNEIQKAAKDYPITIQQALVAKIILNQESRKAS